MRNLIVGLMATMVMSGVSAYAGTGDNSSKKHVVKKEACCAKADCQKKGCTKNANCPNKPGCVCH